MRGDFGAHFGAARELGRGEIVGVGGIDSLRARSPRHEAATRPGRAEADVIELADPAHPEPQPRRNRDALVRGAARHEHVAIAGRVDHDLGLHDLATLLRFEHDRLDAAVGCVRVRAPRVQTKSYAGGAQQIERHVAEVLGVERDRIAHDVGRRTPDESPLPPMFDRGGIGRSPLRRRGMASVEPVDELLTQARDDLGTAAVVEREQQIDEPEGREAADEAVPLDEPHVGTAARGRDRGRDSRAARTDDEHVGRTDDGEISRRLPPHVHGRIFGAWNHVAQTLRLSTSR